MIGCAVVKARMRATAIVKIEIAPERCAGLTDAIVGAEVDFLVFHRTPETFDEDVVPPRAINMLVNAVPVNCEP